MIIEWLVAVGEGFIGWLTGLMPEWDPPAWFIAFDEQVNGVFATLDGLGAWIDWVLLLVVVGLALATWLTCLSIKALRAVASYVPFFGGSG